MKKLLFTLLGLYSVAVWAQPNVTTCEGEFALCAAATCTPTGKMITVKTAEGGTAQFPESVCKCPIMRGSAIADLNGGNMNGSCAAPSKRQVWSLFQPNLHQPQEMNGWRRNLTDTKAPIQLCRSDLNIADQSVNCFSFVCDRAGSTGTGTRIANCYCPIGEGGKGGPVAPNSLFFIQAGQGDPSYCAKHPVAAAFPPPQLPLVKK